ISASILASMAVAVTVLPAMAARMLPTSTPAGSMDGGAFDRIGRWVGMAYRSATRRAAILLGTLVASGLAVVWLTPPAEYLPEGEEARIFARMIAPPGYNLAEIEGIAQVLIPEFQQRLQDD